MPVLFRYGIRAHYEKRLLFVLVMRGDRKAVSGKECAEGGGEPGMKAVIAGIIIVVLFILVVVYFLIRLGPGEEE